MSAKRENITGSFKELLINELKDPELASEYINAAIEDGDIRVFLMALGDVAKARGMSRISRKTGLNRENIYRIISEQGNPKIKSVAAILEAVGLRIVTEPVQRTAPARLKGHVRSYEAFATVAGESNSSVMPGIGSVSFGAGKRYMPAIQQIQDLACAA